MKAFLLVSRLLTTELEYASLPFLIALFFYLIHYWAFFIDKLISILIDFYVVYLLREKFERHHCFFLLRLAKDKSVLILSLTWPGACRCVEQPTACFTVDYIFAVVTALAAL